MIQVSKKEINNVRKLFPHLHVKRTVHKYYVEESNALIQYLLHGVKKNG